MHATPATAWAPGREPTVSVAGDLVLTGRRLNGDCSSARLMPHRLSRRRPGLRLGIQPQVRQDRLYHRPFQDRRDDLEFTAAAVRAVLHVGP